MLWPIGEAALVGRAVIRPLASGDQEIAWLNPATSAVAWERFVAAVHRLQIDRAELGIEIAQASNPFPVQTTMVPELALTRVGRSGRLWFRWYKLTADLGPAEWVRALAQRQPPPLAVMGGSSSDRARDLALELQGQQAHGPNMPLFFITTATADRLENGQALMQIYPERTFRFCFTNGQMAEAVADFIWHRDEFRPDSLPIYLVRWADDPYSMDLFNQFHDVLGPEKLGKQLEETRLVKAFARRWAWGATVPSLSANFGPLNVSGIYAEDLESPEPFWSARFPYSIGAFSQPNRQEAEGADSLIDELNQHPSQRRPLLVMPATAQPARRFLRALVRTAPYDAERFIIATGDAIDFNTIFRDRGLTWPIQDFPIPVIFFCHRNPVDPEAFQPREGSAAPDPMGRTSTGTQDLLLYRDIVETAVEAAFADNRLVAGADAFAQSLRTPGPEDRRNQFRPNGDLVSGTREFVVCLRPVREGDRIPPQARIQVWNRQTRAGAQREWTVVSIAGRTELMIPYVSGGWILAPEAPE
jgi:hypothetical protein